MSPASPKEFYPEANDTPKRFDVETHQIEVFRGSKKGEELWEFLEKLEERGMHKAANYRRRSAKIVICEEDNFGSNKKRCR